jgi:TolB-like protein
MLIAVLAVLAFGSLGGQIAPPGRDVVTLFVLDFDNLQGDERMEWLSKALKDMILLHVEEEPRIKGRDAGDITPFLEARVGERGGEPRHMASNSILLMGAFRREDARLVIDLQLLDMKDWTSLTRQSIEALYGDIPQLNDMLVTKVVSMVKGLEYFSGIDLDAPPEAAPPVFIPEPTDRAYAPPEDYGEQIPALQEDLARAIEDLEEAMDVYSGYKQEPETEGTLQAGESYYRDFTLEGTGALPEEKARYTEIFEDHQYPRGVPGQGDAAGRYALQPTVRVDPGGAASADHPLRQVTVRVLGRAGGSHCPRRLPDHTGGADPGPGGGGAGGPGGQSGHVVGALLSEEGSPGGAAEAVRTPDGDHDQRLQRRRAPGDSGQGCVLRVRHRSQPVVQLRPGGGAFHEG